jgi:hypothetical protein
VRLRRRDEDELPVGRIDGCECACPLLPHLRVLLDEHRTVAEHGDAWKAMKEYVDARTG